MVGQVIIFIAPPGAGKGTQANLIAKKFNLVHLETSKIIEEKFRNTDPDDTEMQEEKRKWANGELNTPAKVTGWFLEKAEEIASRGKGIVLSGSPRSLYEAEIEMPELEKLYGHDNIKVFHITLSEEESIKRNSTRRICQLNRHPMPGFPQYQHLATCPQDGSPLITRGLDKPEIIKERYRVFLNQTAPLIDYFKKMGYKITEINGEQPIGGVERDIINSFKP